MFPQNHKQWAIFQILLMFWMFCSSSILNGQSPEIRAPEPVPSPYRQPSIRKFPFKHAKAADILNILQQLAGQNDHIGLKIAVDERTNSLVFQPDDDRQSREFEETCALLDTETPSASVTGNGVPITIPSLGPKPLAFDFSIGIVRDETVESLKHRYNELEQQAHQLADKLKTSKSLSEAQRTELQLAVRKSFEARQALQRAELADLAQRMKNMQQSIDMRDKLADKVVQRRVEDLLNLDLKWEVTQANNSSTQAIPKRGSGSQATITSAKEMQALLQGTWDVRTFQTDNEGVGKQTYQAVIRGEVLLLELVENGHVLGTSPWKVVWPNTEKPFEVEVFWDPNSQTETTPGMPGRIAYDAKSFQLAFGEKRPSEICPGEKIVYIDCTRATGVISSLRESASSTLDSSLNESARSANLNDSTANPKSRTVSGEADLSTPQATLDYLHRYSLAHPGDFPFECYTDDALLELSGMMLQNLSMMSAMSRIALQTDGVIGEKDGVPVVLGMSPAFYIQVDALLIEHISTTPTESANRAYQLLVKLTFGSKSSSAASLVHADRQLIRMAAGVLKSPKEFLPAASKLLTAFGENDADVTKAKETAQTQPKADIAINGDEATATFITSGDDASPSPLTTPRVTKLRRIDGRWLIREILTDEEISQMQSSMSSVMDQFGGATEVKSASAKIPESVKQKSPKSAVESSKTEPPEWNQFLKQVPESGTALVMFSYEPEIKEQMLPVAQKIAETASVQFIELPQTTWHKIIAPPATHFVLMKDRQVVGTRTGLMTETRLQEFVSKAKDWLTPQAIGIEENSLVRIDCYINPGTDNIGSQHGEAFSLTTAVVAVHGYQTLLLGPESMAEYIEKGFACAAIVRDAYGQQKQLPLDVVLKGPVKLAARGSAAKKSAATASISFGEGASKEIPLPFLDSIYPESFTELLEAYDVGSAIYHISGAHGLTPVKLAAVNDPPQKDQRVLSGSFTREHHSPPLRGFRSPIHWQSQTVSKAGGHIYGGNINGAEMFEVLCPTRPAPCGFTFNEHGRLVGRYGLGEPSEKSMTHTVFKPDTTHSVLQAALEKLDAPGLKAALAQTLEESKTAASIKELNRLGSGDEANANTSHLSTRSPAKFETPQALLARVDESCKAGSYEEFIALFSEEGVRDLAGSMLMSAVMQTSIDELSRQLTFGGVAEVDPDFVAFRKVLQRWLPQSVTTAQQEAMGKGLSTMMSSLGGASPDPAAMKEFVTSMRKSVGGISDHRKFCIEIMQAFEKLTTSKFVLFGNADNKNEWQISPFGDRAIATLIDGSPGMATTITLQQANGTWRISSLFNELVIEAQPATPSPTSIASIPSNAKTVTRSYSVGSFVTEGFFTGKGNRDTKEVYDKYETEISQSLEDLAKTLTAACTQPPKFVQVLSNSRCLLIGHTEAGHQEIVDFMRDIGINNDRVRLRGFVTEITKDKAKTLGIELSQQILQQVLSAEQVEEFREFSKSNPSAIGDRKSVVSFAAMDETLVSGTQRPLTSNSDFSIPLTIAARIVPGSRQIQIRMDKHGLGNVEIQFVAPQFQTLNDGQSVLFHTLENCYWIVTAEIVHDTNALSEKTDKAASNPQAPSTPAAEILQRLQGEWNVKTVTFSAGDPKDLVIRDDLLLLPGNLLGKSIVTSMKLEWPNPNMPEEVDIIWEPNDQPSANVIMEPLVGRIRCEGDQLQLCFLDGSRKVAQRPREMCGGTGIFYLECTRKQDGALSKPLKASESDAHSSQRLKYSGQTLSWWLDSYWDNATAIPKTTVNETQEYVASEAIHKLREKPECEAVIEAALSKWFASVEHEVNEIQLVRAAKCFVFVAGSEHQKLAVDSLFKIWRELPTLSFEKLIELSSKETELNDLLKQLVLNDELAVQFAERLTNGTSSDRSLVTYYLFSSIGLKDEKDPKVTELNTWLQNHRELFFPAFTAALKDESEQVRWFTLFSLAPLMEFEQQPANLRSTITSVIETDASSQVRCIAFAAIGVLYRKGTLSVAELAPLMIKTLEHDSSIDVRNAALEALMAMDTESELVHKTLMVWAKSDDRQKVKYALDLTLLNYKAGDRPQSIDELMELLSDPEWGTKVEVNYNNWSTHHRWARQYALAILGEYSAHAHLAIPTLEAELALNNKDTLSFATKALDRARGYCPDLPIDKLQGDWEFVSMQKPEGSTPFFDFQASSDQQPSSVITISGTQLRLGDRVLAELSHDRSGSRQGMQLLLDPNGKKLYCNGRHDFNPEFQISSSSKLEWVKLEVHELLGDWGASQTTKQTYEFRPVTK